MEATYKIHLIKSVGREIPDSNRWWAKVIISWSETGGEKFQPIDSPLAGFTSQNEAELWGLQFGKKWIDDGKPDFHK